jgi:PTH1 family peptidyl-tRNA hydrolase
MAQSPVKIIQMIDSLKQKLTSQRSESSEGKYLLVGLGNPGRAYRKNRHNIGFMVVDKLAEVNGIKLSRRQKKALTGTGRISGQSVILAQPQTYMNRSGESIIGLVNFYKLSLKNVLIIYDEIDLPLGLLRMREKGGSGGHNGVKSVIEHMGKDFPRLRLGVGRPPGRQEPSSYLLQDFRGDQMLVVEDLIDLAVETIEVYLSEGIEIAMTQFNGVSVNS